ncbi:hypothetical protein [Helicobacter sp. 11S02629-2]|uniref:hypothetical protein n=1 Tax=Helicobacter sp. 11S02629-2 TaxID=1476195 RepID=UPI000BA768AE|nr:hypothetical protein [Helicobacter sp. 11S02629-2]PAF42883.1 hypothetical protein BKH40_07400 [Helicobacter sp. 11S02629-2]
MRFNTFIPFCLVLLTGCASQTLNLGSISFLTPSKPLANQTHIISKVCYQEIFFYKSKDNKPLTFTSLLESSPLKTYQDVSVWHSSLNFGHVYTKSCLELRDNKGEAR